MPAEPLPAEPLPGEIDLSDDSTRIVRRTAAEDTRIVDRSTEWTPDEATRVVRRAESADATRVVPRKDAGETRVVRRVDVAADTRVMRRIDPAVDTRIVPREDTDETRIVRRAVTTPETRPDSPEDAGETRIVSRPATPLDDGTRVVTGRANTVISPRRAARAAREELAASVDAEADSVAVVEETAEPAATHFTDRESYTTRVVDVAPVTRVDVVPPRREDTAADAHEVHAKPVTKERRRGLGLAVVLVGVLTVLGGGVAILAGALWGG